MIENADPSNPDALRSSGQPEILIGTTGAVDIRIAHCGAPQYLPAPSLAATGHTDINWGFLNPFELPALIEGCAGAFITHRRLPVRLLKKLLHSVFRGLLTNDHKIPWLHEPNRSGVMRRSQNPRKHSISNRRRQEIPTDIPPLEYDTVDGRPFMIGKLSITGHHTVGLQTHTTLLKQRLTLMIGMYLTQPLSNSPV